MLWRCLVVPEVIVSVRAAVNHLLTVSLVVRLTSVSLGGCSVAVCCPAVSTLISGGQIQLNWGQLPVVTSPVI